MPLFKQIKLTSPEGTDQEMTLAGIGSRAFALFIDHHFISLALLLFWLLAGFFSSQFVNQFIELQLNGDEAILVILAMIFLGSLLVYGGYFILFEAFWQGQTPGKRWVKIRVVQENGQRIGWVQAGLRTLLRLVDELCLLGPLLIVLGQREQRLGDRVARTIVIQEAKPEASPTLTFSSAAQQLAPELASLTDLTNLQADDFAVIQAYLFRREQMATQPRSELSLKLAREIRAIVQLAEIPPGLTSDQFLEAIYLAAQPHFSQ